MPLPQHSSLPPTSPSGHDPLGRQMAAHVHNAIYGPLQAKAAEPPLGVGQMALHVQVAIATGRGVGGQPKMVRPLCGGQRAATHVQRAAWKGNTLADLGFDQPAPPPQQQQQAPPPQQQQQAPPPQQQQHGGHEFSAHWDEHHHHDAQTEIEGHAAQVAACFRARAHGLGDDTKMGINFVHGQGTRIFVVAFWRTGDGGVVRFHHAEYTAGQNHQAQGFGAQNFNNVQLPYQP